MISTKLIQPRYDKDEDSVWYARHLVDNKFLYYVAKNLRMEKTGVHATLFFYIGRDGDSLQKIVQLLRFSEFNISREAERRKLSKGAFEELTQTQQNKLPLSILQHETDLFCLVAWDTRNKGGSADMVEGKPPAQVDWLCDGMVLNGAGSILFGQQGMGKSTISLLIAASIDSGDSIFYNVKQANTLFINLERSGDSLARRLGRVNEILGYPQNRSMLMLNERGRSLADIEPIIKQAVKDHDIKFMVLDSISRSGTGDLNSNTDINKLMNSLNNLAPSYMALGHQPKGGTSLYGSVLQSAAADIMIRLHSTKDDDGRIAVALQVTKANDISFPPVRVFEFGFDALGLSDVKESSLDDWPGLQESITPSTASLVEDYVTSNPSSSTEEIAKAIDKSRNYVSEVINSSGKYDYTQQGKTKLFSIKNRS